MAHIIYTYKGKVINLSSLAAKLKKLGVAGASLSNLSRVFSGRHRPRFDLAMAISRVGGVPIEEVESMLAHTKKQHAAWKYAPVFGVAAMGEDVKEVPAEDEKEIVGRKS